MHPSEGMNCPLTFVILETSISQLSVAIGNTNWAAAKASVLLHSIIVFKAVAWVVQVGAVVSSIVITWVNTSEVFPQSSFTVQVLV